jgi:hypothetical protein
MMNFYQDDFLSHFNLKHPPLGTEIKNPRMTVNLTSTGIFNGKIVNSGSKPSNAIPSKHKAHSTLNHYLNQNA